MKSAGMVAPSPKRRHRVVFAQPHGTLNAGDVVVVLELPGGGMSNVLLRESDMTLHRLQDLYEQYVILENVENVENVESVENVENVENV